MRVQTPSARSSDPASSHAAGEAITRSGVRQTHIDLIVDFVHRHPGLTSKEIALALQHPGIDRYEAARRLNDAKGLTLKQGPVRNCTACKAMRLCVTWWPIGARAVVHG